MTQQTTELGSLFRSYKENWLIFVVIHFKYNILASRKSTHENLMCLPKPLGGWLSMGGTDWPCHRSSKKREATHPSKAQCKVVIVLQNVEEHDEEHILNRIYILHVSFSWLTLHSPIRVDVQPTDCPTNFHLITMVNLRSFCGINHALIMIY